MKRFLNTTIIALWALAIPGAALATVSGTQVLAAGQNLDMDTNTVSSSGGDLSWDGQNITFVGTATGFALSSKIGTGQATFNQLSSAAILQSFSSSYTTTAITSGELALGDIFAVKTNLGNFGAVLVLANAGGGSITLQFITFSAVTPPPNGPTITQVLNNYGLIPSGFSNSGIAPGALFIIKGSGLASTTSVSSLESATTGSGLPTTLNGASVEVTVGNKSVTPAFYYAENVQLALVLPNETPVGPATVTVSYNNQTSAPFSFNVVQSAFGFASASGAPGGQAHVQDLNYNYYGYTNSIPQGATIRLIGSGLGADSVLARDALYVQQTASQISGLSNVYVGGVLAKIVYQGAEGYPGLDEVDITIPANAPTGCFVSVVGVSAGTGAPTNFLTVPIGSGECEDPGLGYNGNTFTNLSGQTTVNTGFVEIIYNTSPASNGSGTQTNTDAGAEFLSYTGAQYGSGSGIVSIGGCFANENLGTATTTTGTSTGLNAGTITVSSPNGGAAPVTLQSEASIVPGFYGAQLPSGFLTQSGGLFQFQATAGTQVGAFNASINFPTPLINWTNEGADATVVRSNGVTVTWTGGTSGTYVAISGSSSAGGVTGYFSCLAPVAAQTFTVPGYVLETLPASTTGSLTVGNETAPQQFSAPGLNYGFAIGLVAFDITATYQ